MWNFGVYSDNINDAISHSVGGIVVRSEVVRAVIYADDNLRLSLRGAS